MDFMLGCDAEGNIGKEANAMKYSLENLRDIVEIMLTGQCIYIAAMYGLLNHWLESLNT